MINFLSFKFFISPVLWQNFTRLCLQVHVVHGRAFWICCPAKNKPSCSCRWQGSGILLGLFWPILYMSRFCLSVLEEFYTAAGLKLILSSFFFSAAAGILLGLFGSCHYSADAQLQDFFLVFRFKKGALQLRGIEEFFN